MGLPRAFTFLRLVATLKRVVLALEEGNRLKKEELSLSFPEWGKREGPWTLKGKGFRPLVKKATFDVPTTQEWNAAWRRGKGLPEDQAPE